MAEYHRAETVLTSSLPSPKLPRLHAQQGNNDRLDDGRPTPLKNNRADPHETPSLPNNPRDKDSAFSLKPSQGPPWQWNADTSLSFAGGLWKAIERTPSPKIGNAETSNRNESEPPRLIMVDWSMACRYLATLCLVCHILED